MLDVREPLWSRVREVSDVLSFTFDFEPFERPLSLEAYAAEAPWLPEFVIPEASVSLIARNGMGAVYAACERGAARSCLHIDRRGTVVSLGDDLREVVALVVELPYWPELLAECSLGDLPALRALAQRLEQESCDDLYALPAARDELRSFLELPELLDPVLRLYELAIQPPPVTVLSQHGWSYESPIRGSLRPAASL